MKRNILARFVGELQYLNLQHTYVFCISNGKFESGTSNCASVVVLSIRLLLHLMVILSILGSSTRKENVSCQRLPFCVACVLPRCSPTFTTQKRRSSVNTASANYAMSIPSPVSCKERSQYHICNFHVYTHIHSQYQYKWIKSWKHFAQGSFNSIIFSSQICSI